MVNKKLQFTVHATQWHARAWTITLNGVSLPTPVFMPVGTKATIKWMMLDVLQDPRYLGDLPAIKLILANTYHLYLRPWSDIVQQAWWLHKFENRRDGLILTDSGGFQVFSLWLGKTTKWWTPLASLKEEWVKFRSIHDWSAHMFTPENVVDTQCALGSDIMMMLDVCSPPGLTQKKFAQQMQLTHRRAKRAYDYYMPQYEQHRGVLFPIVQWWLYEDLRQESIDVLSQYAHDGIAVWWVSVGEPVEEIRRIASFCGPKLPQDKPRYLMGIGEPDGIRHAIEQGFDMFDCVLPTRLGRHGAYYTDEWVKKINRSSCKNDFSSLTQDDTWINRNFTKAYIHHLCKEKEMLGWMLLSLHNILYLHRMVTNIRKEIMAE